MKKDKIFIKKLVTKYKNLDLLSVTGINSLFETKFMPGYYFEGECHSPWEMVYVIEGSVGITADDQVYTLSKGDIFLHRPMEFHKIWSADGTNPHVLISSFNLDGSSIYNLGGAYHLTDDAKNVVNLFFKFLHTELKEDTSNVIDFYNTLSKNEICLQIIFDYLELILLYLSRFAKKEEESYHNKKMKLYTEIVEILEEHIHDKITIPQISKMCNVSTATIKNCFAEFAGCTVHKYFLNIKMRAAIDMLKSGMFVNEVSDVLQFSNPNYFSYVFKRETGICASAYKNGS